MQRGGPGRRSGVGRRISDASILAPVAAGGSAPRSGASDAAFPEPRSPRIPVASDDAPNQPGATDALFSAVYDELKRMARHQLHALAADATLSTTELVHEAFLKLADRTAPGWEGRAHFFGAASRAMRQVLVDFARRRRAGKRGGDWRAVSLSDADASLELELDQVLALDTALDRLDAADPRLRRVVELRFFGGVPEQDIAKMLGVSVRTVERDWLKARLFLLGALEEGDDSRGGAENRASSGDPEDPRARVAENP